MLRFLFILFVFCSCDQDCKHENVLPSKEVDYSTIFWSDDLNKFFFFTDSISKLKSLTISVYKEQLTEDDFISFYDDYKSLAIYKVNEVNPHYLLIETHFPVGELISWKPMTKQFRLKICPNGIQIYNHNESELIQNKAIGKFSILKNMRVCNAC